MNTYSKLNHKTTNGNTIYLQTCTTTGLQRYKVKSRTMVLKPKGKLYKTAFISSWRDLDPAENEQLFFNHPERFSGYIHSCIMEAMIHNRQTWDERQTVDA